MNSIMGSVEESISLRYQADIEVSDMQMESAWYNPTVRPRNNTRVLNEV